MKKIFFLLIFIFLVCLVTNVKADYNIFDADDNINVFTYWTYQNNSAVSDDVSCAITTMSPNTSFLVQNQPMTNNWDGSSLGFFNYSFGILDTEGIYSALVHCNDTNEGVISFDFSVGDVGETQDNIKWLYIFFLLIPVFLILCSYLVEDKWFLMFAGFTISIFGVYIQMNGLLDLSNTFMEYAFYIILFGIGAYLILTPAIDLIKEGG